MLIKDHVHANRIFNTEPGGKRGRGKQRFRWINVIVEDMRTLGYRNCKIMVHCRDEW